MTGGYGDHYGNGVDILSLDQRKYILLRIPHASNGLGKERGRGFNHTCTRDRPIRPTSIRPTGAAIFGEQMNNHQIRRCATPVRQASHQRIVNHADRHG
jgi:hypothetical protein